MSQAQYAPLYNPANRTQAHATQYEPLHPQIDFPTGVRDATSQLPEHLIVHTDHVQPQPQSEPIAIAMQPIPQPLPLPPDATIVGMAGGAIVPVVVHVEPAYISRGMKALMLVVIGLLLITIVVRLTVLRDSPLNSFWIVYFVVLLIAVAAVAHFRWPQSVTLAPTCVVLNTRCTSFSLSYERVQSVEVLPSVCCWFGAKCSNPKGGFTSFSNGVFFRSPDCGQSIAFSPTDFNAFVAALQASPLGNRIIRP